jgi:nicotinamidase/pyrazinamidase
MGSALIVVDAQYDFLPGGALGVEGGFDIIEPIIEFGHSELVDLVVFTKDWHSPNHIGHRRAAGGAEPTFTDGDWPVHCVAGLQGSLIADELLLAFNDAPIFYKGTDDDVEEYSAFAGRLDQGGVKLDRYLSSEGINNLYVAGLAFDFCVGETAFDAFGLGYETTVLADATRAVSFVGGIETAAKMGRYQGNGLEVDTVDRLLA